MRTSADVVAALGLTVALGLSVESCALEGAASGDEAVTSEAVAFGAQPSAGLAPKPILVSTAVFMSERDKVVRPYERSNYATLPSGSPSNKLLLFLPGTGCEPLNYEHFFARAATRGYHVIGLDYLNDHSPTSLCGYWSTCYGRLLEQNVDGIDHDFYKDTWDVTTYPRAYNSIHARLYNFLTWLGPAWKSRFWDSANGEPMWSNIVVAGHSGGSSHALWIAKHKSPHAAILFAGPNTHLNAQAPRPDQVDTIWHSQQGSPEDIPAAYIPSSPSWKTSVFALTSEGDARYHPDFAASAGDPDRDAGTSGYGANQVAALCRLGLSLSPLVCMPQRVDANTTSLSNNWVSYPASLDVGHFDVVGDNTNGHEYPNVWDLLLVAAAGPHLHD